MRGLVVVVVVSLLACGDDDSGSGEYVSVADFDSAYKEAECTYLVNCGLFPDQATCLAASLFNGGAYSLSADLRAEIAAGHVIYNGSAVKACFDAIANATCDKTDAAGRLHNVACLSFIRGTAGADAPCQIDADCISQDCRVTVADERCAMGTCFGETPPSFVVPRNGEHCSTVVGCQASSYCDTSTFECTPLKLAGDACIDVSECEFGLGCAGTPRTCMTLPGPNEACPDAICRDDGLHCAAAICKPLGLPGAMCTSSGDCSPYFPCDFATSMCKKPPSIGESCPAGNTRCFEDHSYCDGATLKCVAGKADGEICTTSLQCASQSCDFVTGTCGTPSCSG